MFTHYTYTQLKSIGVHLSPGSEVIPSNNIHDYNVVHIVLLNSSHTVVQLIM